MEYYQQAGIHASGGSVYNTLHIAKMSYFGLEIDPDTESLEMRGDQGVAATGLDSEGSQSSVLPSPSSPN